MAYIFYSQEAQLDIQRSNGSSNLENLSTLQQCQSEH